MNQGRQPGGSGTVRIAALIVRPGVPSDEGEDEVKVCVVLLDGTTVTPEDLHQFLVERMPAFMVPRYIEFVVDPERTEAMKRVKKPALRVDPLNARTWDARFARPVRTA